MFSFDVQPCWYVANHVNRHGHSSDRTRTAFASDGLFRRYYSVIIWHIRLGCELESPFFQHFKTSSWMFPGSPRMLPVKPQSAMELKPIGLLKAQGRAHRGKPFGSTIFLCMVYLQMMPKKVGDGFFLNNSFKPWTLWMILTACDPRILVSSDLVGGLSFSLRWTSSRTIVIWSTKQGQVHQLSGGTCFFFSSRSHLGTRYHYEVFSLVFFWWMAQPQTSSPCSFWLSCIPIRWAIKKNTSPFNPSSDHHLDSIIIIPFGNQRWLENHWKPLKTIENHHSVRWCSSFFSSWPPFLWHTFWLFWNFRKSQFYVIGKSS